MKIKVQRIPFKSLNRNEQLSFTVRILLIMTKYCAQFGKSFDLFKAAADELGYCMHLQQNKESTSLSRLDQDTDEAYIALSHQVAASKMHPIPSVREAGLRIAQVFDRFKNPTRKTHDNAYGTLRLLTEAFDEIDVADRDITGITPFLDHLKASIKAFTTAQDSILENKQSQKSHSMQNAVKACSTAWSDLAHALETAAENEFVPGAAEAIAQINIINREINIRLDARKTRLKKAREAAAATDTTSEDLDVEATKGENIVEEIVAAEG